jgi:flagellar brake protein
MSASLSDEEIEDRYFLLGRMEILSVLNELIYRREQVTVSFNGGRESFLTSLLEARHDALIFDLSGDARANVLVEKSPSCLFVARLNGILVQFRTEQVNRFSWGGSDAFWVPLPERVVRRQRRESYRILLPVAKPLMAKLYLEDGIVFGEWPAHDLSVGGLGLSMVGDPALEQGQKIDRLNLLLPKQRAIVCSAAVRHVTFLSDHQNIPRYRVGLAFSELSPAMGVAIQRYITEVEHERRSLARENARSGSG